MPSNPDSDLLLPVTFTPTHKGTFSTQYELRWRDLNGLHTVTVILSGTAT
jgi:hypothetical protein